MCFPSFGPFPCCPPVRAVLTRKPWRRTGCARPACPPPWALWPGSWCRTRWSICCGSGRWRATSATTPCLTSSPRCGCSPTPVVTSTFVGSGRRSMPQSWRPGRRWVIVLNILGVAYTGNWFCRISDYQKGQISGKQLLGLFEQRPENSFVQLSLRRTINDKWKVL